MGGGGGGQVGVGVRWLDIEKEVEAIEELVEMC